MLVHIAPKAGLHQGCDLELVALQDWLELGSEDPVVKEINTYIDESLFHY